LFVVNYARAKKKDQRWSEILV